MMRWLRLAVITLPFLLWICAEAGVFWVRLAARHAWATLLRASSQVPSAPSWPRSRPTRRGHAVGATPMPPR